MRKADVIGFSVVGVLVGGILLYELTRPKASSGKTTGTGATASTGATPSLPTPANWTQQGYNLSTWTVAKAYGGTGVYPGNAALIGPGAGNQPNGVYYLVRYLNTAVSGSAALSFMADDVAVVYLDGVQVATSYGCSLCNGTPVTAQVNLSAGTHVLAVQVANNGGVGNGYVAYNSGSPNPTGLSLTLTQGSQTLASTASASGWLMLAYPSKLLSPNPMPLVGGATS